MKRSVLERLTRYYIILCERELFKDRKIVSSAQIAECVGMDDTQVRKDLAQIGVKGRPHVGFMREKVIAAIRDSLGFAEDCKAVIVGAGRLGGALAEYPGFFDFGLSIVALFDIDLEKVGTKVGRCKVYPAEKIKQVIKRHGARLAILTCPADAAQGLADQLTAAGVRAIWNFAPTIIAVPEDVVVNNQYISVGLTALTYHLRRSGER